MAGEIEAYQDASVALKQNAAAMRQMLSLVREFMNAADRGWDKIVVNGVEGVPAYIMVSGAPTFSPQSWPTGETIANMLLTWHRLASAKRNAWDKVPKERREGLTPP